MSSWEPKCDIGIYGFNPTLADILTGALPHVALRLFISYR